ncbi:hypothetical protein SCATT_16070 [Streptantibioticus cattleyicolor NRRL 8057 = DSM 46488]|uniref:Uncharacterized protein n=1 Tax=Streptantibioticus cattleyicolor (strain ATCC 35852 / DSM 46488 / JCM 4925 / NBRC 14057 / NRRL 8057) TaxID=1003195 RepID=G8WND4_STREN|nr:hypothetical protein SCATT_16070 [Streptantibioticus cattleyicolor NRRL 8057 = DSM 46488]
MGWGRGHAGSCFLPTPGEGAWGLVGSIRSLHSPTTARRRAVWERHRLPGNLGRCVSWPSHPRPPGRPPLGVPGSSRSAVGPVDVMRRVRPTPVPVKT